MPKLVAIVGRANVGKSRLFNRIIGKRRAIVSDRSGVTRDRHYALASWDDNEFIVVDTGGIDLEPANDLEKQVTTQSMKAISEADLVICVFDGRSEPTSYDRDITNKLREVNSEVIFVVNKIDNADENMLIPYYSLGVDLIAVSAEHGPGFNNLMNLVIKHLGDEKPKIEDENESKSIKISIIGRPNVGKSTLLNQLIGEERSIVNDTPGTTRDPIDVSIIVDGRKCTLLDTAGIRRKRGDHVEWITSIRSAKAMSNSDVTCLVIDGIEGIVHQDLELASLALDEGRGLIIAVNKCDEATFDQNEGYKYIKKRLGEMSDTEVLFISAKDGTNCKKIVPSLLKIYDKWNTRLSTSAVNKILQDAVTAHHPPSSHGKEVKFFYGTQVESRPPTFVLFSNLPDNLDKSYVRYLSRKFREALGGGIPIRIDIKKREK